MPTPDQKQFMHRIRTALSHAPGAERGKGPLFPDSPTAEALEILDRIRRRTPGERERLLASLAEAAGPINLRLMALKDGAAVADAIAELVSGKAPEWGDAKSVAVWRHPLLDSLDLAAVLARRQVPVRATTPVDAAAGAEALRRQREEQRRHIIESYIGITGADFCMADSATLVMRNRPGQPRSVAIVPSIHIAVIRLDQVIADMKELFALIRWDEDISREGLSNYMSFISGPSKTADIEATMVHGAHGPREVHLFVIAGQ